MSSSSTNDKTKQFPGAGEPKTPVITAFLEGRRAENTPTIRIIMRLIGLDTSSHETGSKLDPGRGIAATTGLPRLARGGRRKRLRRDQLEVPCRKHVFSRFGLTKELENTLILGHVLKA